jgi:hypothetical protein
MTDNFDVATPVAAPLTDDHIAGLVHDAADSWQLPADVLGRSRWRELVHENARRFGSPGGLFRRLRRAAALALALVVLAAAAGVLITRLRTADLGTSGPPTRAVAGPTTSPSLTNPHAGLPIGVNPLLVRLDSGYALVDLAKGTIGPTIALGDPGSLVRQLDDGSVICICVTADSTAGSVTREVVSWQRLGSDGGWTGFPIETFVGLPDPRGTTLTFDPSASISISPAGDSAAYVGWSTRQHPIWRSGLIAVDLASGAVLQRVDLPDRDDGPDSQPVIVPFGPQVIGAAGENRVLISRPRWSVSMIGSGGPTASHSPSVETAFDAFVAPTSSGTIGMYHAVGAAQPLAGLNGCGESPLESGSIGDAGWWATCESGDGIHLRTFDSNDAQIREQILDNTTIGTTPDTYGTVNAAGTALYAWNPVALKLTKVELATGRRTVADDPTARGDLLARIGDWLTPPATAKGLWMPTIALSPDGSRAYALGIESDANPDSTTSIGITVVDTDIMLVLGHWPAAANYDSIASSADGSVVFVAAPTSASQPSGSSITALDAATGTPRTSIGGLGFEPLFFTDSQLP